MISFIISIRLSHDTNVQSNTQTNKSFFYRSQLSKAAYILATARKIQEADIIFRTFYFLKIQSVLT